MNTWPGGYKHAISQGEHERWNALHYPGTRQLCSICDNPTGKCEEDGNYIDDVGPLCDDCWDNIADSNNQKGEEHDS